MTSRRRIVLVALAAVLGVVTFLLVASGTATHDRSWFVLAAVALLAELLVVAYGLAAQKSRQRR